MPIIKAGRHNIEFGQRTLIMGILNITPDSFSDGGRFFEPEQAVVRARQLIASGVDLIDIGGESSRPGSIPIDPQEEIKRIVPVVRHLTENFPEMPLSVDTWKHEVAAAALESGASIINDIYGLQADVKLPGVCREYDAGVILMHNAAAYRLTHPAAVPFRNPFRLDQASAERLEKLPLNESLKEQLAKSISIAESAGIGRSQLILDPGLGFGLTTEESLQMIRDLNLLKQFNLPLLLAPSRKRFIGDVLGVPVDQRQSGTAAAAASGIWCGADIVRIHDVEQILPVIRMTDAIQKTNSSAGSNIGHNRQEHDTIAGTGNQQARLVQAPHNARIIMNGLKFRGYVGVLAEEKSLGQDFTVDLVLELLHDQAFFSDRLSDTVSYADVFDQVKKIVSTVNFDLIEKLAGYIAEQVIASYPRILAAVEVTVGKPQAPIAGSFDTMAVKIRRTSPLG